MIKGFGFAQMYRGSAGSSIHQVVAHSGRGQLVVRVHSVPETTQPYNVKSTAAPCASDPDSKLSGPPMSLIHGRNQTLATGLYQNGLKYNTLIPAFSQREKEFESGRSAGQIRLLGPVQKVAGELSWNEQGSPLNDFRMSAHVGFRSSTQHTETGSPCGTRGDPHLKSLGRGLGPDVVGIRKGSPNHIDTVYPRISKG